MGKLAKTKILINGRFLTQNVSGVQRYSIEVVKALDDMLNNSKGDIAVGIAFPQKSKLVTQLKLKNIVERPCGSFTGHIWEQMELPRQQADVLLCLGNTAPLISLFSTKVITVVHDLSYKYFPDAYSTGFKAAYNFLIPWVLKKSKRVFTVSNSERSSIEKHYPKMKNKIMVGHCGGFSKDVQDSFDQHEKTEKKNIFIYVGSLNPRKNLKGFLAAFEKIQSSNNFEAHVIGGGDKVFVDYELKSFQNNERIKFLGQINDPHVIAQKMKEAYALVFPSFYEASPIPPIEAMNCGTAVIASAIPSLQERCGDAAVYCDPNDIDSIARCMDQMIIDPEYNKLLQDKGTENASKFTWENTARALWKEVEFLL